MKSPIIRISEAWQSASTQLDRLLPLADLGARLYIAKVFFMSGLNKIQDWQTTLYLFTEEYKVPLSESWFYPYY